MLHFPLIGLKYNQKNQKYLERVQIKWFSIQKITRSQPGQYKLYNTNILLLKARTDVKDYFYMTISQIFCPRWEKLTFTKLTFKLNFKISLIIPGDIPSMTLNKSIARVYILLRGKIGPIVTSEAKCLNIDKILHVTSSSKILNHPKILLSFNTSLKNQKKHVFSGVSREI